MADSANGIRMSLHFRVNLRRPLGLASAPCLRHPLMANIRSQQVRNSSSRPSYTADNHRQSVNLVANCMDEHNQLSVISNRIAEPVCEIIDDSSEQKQQITNNIEAAASGKILANFGYPEVRFKPPYLMTKPIRTLR